MNGEERSNIEVFRAEMNGKLDVVIERLTNFQVTLLAHDARILSLEEKGSAQAREAIKELAEFQVRLSDAEAYVSGEKVTEYTRSLLNRFEKVEDKVAAFGLKLALATGVVTGSVFVVNVGIQRHWF